MTRTLKIPDLIFSNWYTWDDRKSIKNSEYPGIYMMAISSKNLVGHQPLYEDVSYIGMTNAYKGLQGRWYQFYQSIRGKSGHSGGNTVYDKLGHYDTWTEILYVCALPVICNPVYPSAQDFIKMGIVAFLEYDAFAAFMKAVPEQKKPRFNTK